MTKLQAANQLQNITPRIALEIWHDMSDSVTYQSLQDSERHDVVSRLAGLIKTGINNGQLRIEEV
jgi:hypothetical protein